FLFAFFFSSRTRNTMFSRDWSSEVCSSDLNYGQNNPACKKALIEYIEADGIAHGLDMHTRAKAEFLSTFNELILKPRELEYVVRSEERRVGKEFRILSFPLEHKIRSTIVST